MGSNATVTYGSTIADTSPDRAAPIAVLVLPAIATGAGINRVTLIGQITLTTGTLTSAIAAQWYRGTVAENVPIGTAVDLPIAAAVDGAISAIATDNPGVGEIVYSLVLTQTDATTDATVTGVSGVAFGTG